MPWFIVHLVVIVGVCLSCGACSPNQSAAKTLNTPAPKSDEFGEPLFTPAALPKLGPKSSSSGEPIVVPQCYLTVIDKMDVSSNVDGTIKWLGIPMKPNESADAKDVMIHRNMYYRRLRLGDRVEARQILVLLEDSQVYVELDSANKNVEGTKEEARASLEALSAVQEVLQIEENAEKKGASSQQAVCNAKTNAAKFQSEYAKTLRNVTQTKGEYERAHIRWQQHFLRTAIHGEVAVIVKHLGEGVKAAETVLQIQSIDRLQMEGYLDLQYERKVSVGSEVVFEPSLMDPPIKKRAFHGGKAVTSLAIATHEGKLSVVSGGEDGVVNVWNPKEDFAEISWKHGSPIRAIACTRPGVAPLTLVGCADGTALIYDLTKLSKSARLTLDGQHEGGVQAVAVSPDAKKCVTADDRGNIFLSDALTGKRLYAFPRSHNSSVSALHFTPQCKVVSVGRDNVVHLWDIGTKGAVLKNSFDNRTGNVGQLGMAEDGSFLLLDQNPTRMNLVELDAGRTIGTLAQGGDGSKFSTFAAVSPLIGSETGQRLILTAGTSDGVLQLWKFPIGVRGRGAELRKLICDGYVQATAAAFAPIAKDGYIVVGTKQGDVLVWAMPTEAELGWQYKATVTHVDRTIESSGKTVRIYAELGNPKEPAYRLRPGITGTMVVPQP